MADLKLFTTTPDAISLGSTLVDAVYCGSVKVWPSPLPGCPPYYCNTDVDPAGCTDLSSAWFNCQSLTTFPLLDVSQCTNFESTWRDCTNLTSFPLLDVSQGTNFQETWFNGNNLTSFPVLDVSQGTNFRGAWSQCYELTSFPILDVSQGTQFYVAWQGCIGLTSFPTLNLNQGTNFDGAWFSCSNLTTFPAGMFDSCTATDFSNAWYYCALSQTSVDNILVSLDTAGQSNGIVSINGGTSAAPSATGLSAKASLQAKGWTVVTN